MLERGKPFLLAILDGLALNPNPKSNAVFQATKPTLDRLFQTCPHTTLVSYGERVGLPHGQMGNSEVGHLNIGGGRIVQQELTRINLAIEKGSLGKMPELSGTGALHLIGLVSEGGVHSSLKHLLALIQTALQQNVKRIFIHAITDGRDRPPAASIEELGELLSAIAQWRKDYPACEFGVVDIIGRYYAMDRDKRMERTQLAYDLYTQAIGEKAADALSAISARHRNGETDEFLKPIVLSERTFSRTTTVQANDALLFFNFRADRMRQIVRKFFESPLNLKILTLTEYEADFPVDVMFRPQAVKNHFGQVVSLAGLRQLRIAETEKYAHVTYFFNGGVEEALAGEERMLVPSPRDVATYDLKPEMSAREVTAKLIEKLNEKKTDVFILNYANCDMVGHTGNYEAAIKAVETVDECLGKVLAVLDQQGGAAIVTADHGNADQMVDYTTGAPHTFHTMYPVPLIITGSDFKNVKLRDGGALCDIAPTACDILGLKIPPEMTGKSLIESARE